MAGEGVSPAASAASSGSPPGSCNAIFLAEAGRAAGFFSRQLRMTRSTAAEYRATAALSDAGSRPATTGTITFSSAIVPAASASSI